MTFKTFLLLILVILAAGYVYVTSLARGDENSQFNQNTRFQLGKYAITRTIFGLHNAGDARAEYFSRGNLISVEIVQPENSGFSDEILNNFSDKIKNYLGRSVSLFNLDKIPEKNLTESDITEIVNEKRRHVLSGQPNLFVILAADYSPRPNDELAKTYKEFGIVVSLKALKDFTDNNLLAFNSYANSTLLHELGHQIGLKHNSNNNCIMSEHAGINGKALEFYGQLSPQDFCGFEQEQIKSLKIKYSEQ
jgi:predicted Zn-dependent protease